MFSNSSIYLYISNIYHIYIYCILSIHNFTHLLKRKTTQQLQPTNPIKSQQPPATKSTRTPYDVQSVHGGQSSIVPLKCVATNKLQKPGNAPAPEEIDENG